MASKRGPQQEEMWETFKQVKINIPLLDAIKKIPAYAKYLKELCTQKRSHKIPKQIDFTDNVSAIFSGALLPKLQDPGTPIIPIQVGDFKMTRELLDLGASISILPGSLYDQYDFGPLRAAATTVVLADQTPKMPRGILTDVIVKVEDFYFPVDFLVLDYVLGERTKQPKVILGRPFLATANANINCRNGTVDMAFGNRKLRINVFTRGDNSPVDDECFMADVIDECIPLYDSVVSSDGTAETCFLFDRLQVETDKLLEDEERQMEIAAVRGDRPPWSVQVEPLPEKIDTWLKPSMLEAPKVELKELPKHLKYAFLGKDNTLPIIIASNLSVEQENALMEVLVANKEAIGWTIADLKGISPSIVMHKILTDPAIKPAHDAQRRLNLNMREVVKKEVLKWLDAGIIFAISDITWVSPTQTVPKNAGIQVVKDDSGNEVATRPVTGWRICIDYRKLNTATSKDHFPLPFIDQIVEKLSGQKFYCFLDGYSGYNQIAIHPEDQEKTTFTCQYGTFAFRRMPFGLRNATATFQRCMMSIFSDMVGESLEIFMDDFSIFGTSFESCLNQLERVLKRCVETNLVLSWEKSHFMLQEGIVLGHVVSSRGIEVDRAKVQVISTLPHPTNVKGIRSFLGHAWFYRRFIKGFSDITKPLCNLLLKDAPFDFNDECAKAFDILKLKLVEAPILQSPDWSLPIEIMCDASDYVVEAVLGQRVDKKPVAIYYASKTLSDTQLNYTTTEKELLAVVYALDKFRSYIWGSKVIIYSDHSAVMYLMDKKDAKPRLIRWVLLLQEFDLEIRDKKGSENVVSYHLSRIIVENENSDGPINESFPDEHILAVSQNPWFAHIVNFKVANMSEPSSSSRRKRQRTGPRIIRYDSDEMPIIEGVERADIVGDGHRTPHQVLRFYDPFEEYTRHTRMRGMQLLLMRTFDWVLLGTLGADTTIQGLMSDRWRAVLECDSISYVELTREFCSTFSYTAPDFDEPHAVSFSLGRHVYEMSVPDFAVATGFYTREDVQTSAFLQSFRGYTTHQQQGRPFWLTEPDLAQFWGQIANGAHSISVVASAIKNPVHRYLQRIVAYTIASRHSGRDKCSNFDLLCLLSMINSREANITMLLLTSFARVQSIHGASAQLALGPYITRIAETLGVFDRYPTDYFTLGPATQPFPLADTQRIGICTYDNPPVLIPVRQGPQVPLPDSLTIIEEQPVDPQDEAPDDPPA
ncbi:uncharacterized protein LOC143555456 [Bidens hawaiensis]|uniref:uncharacterized protein LOC143555456 n=1 Tax=Bidens hawaiensis TaxID=980011 RepID=UPI00404B8CE9